MMTCCRQRFMKRFPCFHSESDRVHHDNLFYIKDFEVTFYFSLNHIKLAIRTETDSRDALVVPIRTFIFFAVVLKSLVLFLYWQFVELEL